MFYGDFIHDTKSFYSKLMDDESRELYDARMEYFITRNDEKFLGRIADMAKKYKGKKMCWSLESYYKRHPEKKEMPVCVFGAGAMGICTLHTLDILGKKVKGVVDQNSLLWGKMLCEYVIEKPTAIKSWGDMVVIIAAKRIYQLGIYYQLLNLGVNEDNILMNQEGAIYLDIGNQYFDVSQVTASDEGEIFVDAGCFNGATCANALKWAQGNLKKIYAFEADENNILNCDTTLKGLNIDYELYNIAVWDRKDRLPFDTNEIARYGSKISASGGAVVEANSIDNILNGREVTYIKYDIEGSELNALYGTVKTIKKWRPKLAISLYHKPSDVIEIPSFLEKMNMDYHYFIRQYTSRLYETVLYAV